MKKTWIATGIAVVLLAIVYLQCTSSKPADPRGNLYAGSAACAKCHSNLYNSYLHTAHYIASAPASDSTIHGSFAKGLNVFDVNSSQKVVMEKRDNGFFQTYYLDGKAMESRRFDIVTGGIKGESYLYWKGNGLAQLPVSYFLKQHQWLLSPGYYQGHLNYDRAITKRCLECHASYIGDEPNAEQELTKTEQFDKSTLVYSVDCERCHGPGAQHAEFQTNNPQVKTAKFIKAYSSLSRVSKLDMCAQCHSGNKSQMLLSTFSFIPGDTLAKFKLPDLVRSLDTLHLDVHGNQLQLLESSKCFINSKMDCATCHDTHQNQRGNTALFAQKCLTCHSTVNHTYCKLANAQNAQLIKSNCVQCHMPVFASKAIFASTTNKTSGEILVHTHHITIYPEQAKQVLAMFNK